MNLKIISSSYLLPNNKSWRNLQKEYVLEFSDYGNWGKDLITSSPDNILACILFFEDILKNKNLEENDMENQFGLLLQTLEQRLSIATKPTLILISFFEDINILKFSRSSSKMHSIHLWLLKKIYRLCAKYKNLYFCNLDDEFSKIGKGNCIDKRNWYLARCHFSSKGLDVISKTIKRILHRYNLPPSKVLILLILPILLLREGSILILLEKTNLPLRNSFRFFLHMEDVHEE